MPDHPEEISAPARPVVVVGGSSGFIGHALGKALSERFHVVGVSRSERAGDDDITEWRKGDLFNLRDAEEIMRGARFAIHLVHSMLPSARLTQATFEDLDLICADNFARAAKHAGVEQIVYLGGLVPDTKELSPHLASRLEVEKTLGRYGVSVTVRVRAIASALPWLGHVGLPPPPREEAPPLAHLA